MNQKEKKWRYEIKYILEPWQWNQVKPVITEHPCAFRLRFADRLVNNIYFDTPDFLCCRDNLAGISDRKKYRLRWYGDPKLTINPVLETKIKNNSLGRKVLQKLTPQEVEHILDSGYPITEKGTLNPVLQNKYVRSYYESWDDRFRMTVDREVTYQKAIDRQFTHDPDAFKDNRIFLELKFDQQLLAEHKQITRHIPFRPSKHSKYVTGILSCYY